MKPVATAAQAAAKWKARMTDTTTRQGYIDGINAFQGNPMALAAAPDAQAKYKANTAAAVDNGRMAKKLMAADPGSWKQNATTIGANNLSSGATKGAPKAQKAYAILSPIWAQQRSAVAGMPKGGRSNAINRFQTALDIMLQGVGKQ